jgi:hypothetical protein
VHQSTAFTNRRFKEAFQAGPPHSVPPCEPGQNRVSAVLLKGTVVFVRVVVAVRKRTTIPSGPAAP